MNKPTFRAWDKINKKMCDVWELDLKSDSEEVLLSDDWDGAWADFQDIILMQSTGLQDKNGVEIFEGDVVNLDVCNGFDNVNGKCVVQHSTGHSGLVCCHIRSGVEYRIFNNNFNYGYEYEVLGSIHENPELLNEVSGC